MKNSREDAEKFIDEYHSYPIPVLALEELLDEYLAENCEEYEKETK